MPMQKNGHFKTSTRSNIKTPSLAARQVAAHAAKWNESQFHVKVAFRGPMDFVNTATSSRKLTLRTKKWLTVKEAVHLYSVGRSTLYKWIKRRVILSVSLPERGKMRGPRRILAESLDDLFYRQAVQQADEENHQN